MIKHIGNAGMFFYYYKLLFLLYF